jgi:hypothetical protein
MFNRNLQSYHDKQNANETSAFVDGFSAKYLQSCFDPNFPMRVRERNKPVIVEHSCAIGGSRREFNTKAEVI